MNQKLTDQKLNHLQFLTQVGHRLKLNFNKILLSVGVILILFASYVADYLAVKTGKNSWVIGINIYRLDFLLILVALRDGIKKLISIVGYRVIVYLLINHFIDKYLGYDDWSYNDAITLATIELDVMLAFFKERIDCRIAAYILLTCIIDSYLGYTLWSFNNMLTILVIEIDIAISYKQYAKLNFMDTELI